jgi:hypothetical protein
MINPGDLVKISHRFYKGIIGHSPLVKDEISRPAIIIPGNSVMLYLGFDGPWSDIKMQNMARVMWRDQEMVVVEGCIIPVDEYEAG